MQKTKIILTKDRVNGDSRNYGVLEYIREFPGEYQGRTAFGEMVFVPFDRVQEIREVS